MSYKQPAERFNLQQDLSERTNGYAEPPEFTTYLSALLRRIKSSHHSVRLPFLPNHEITE